MRISDWSSDVCSSDLLLARVQDGAANLFLFLVGAPYLEPRRARHAVAQRADRLARDVHGGHVEETELFQRAAMQLFYDCPRIRALHLESPACAGDGLAHRAHRSEVHTSELQSILRRSYAVCCLKKKITNVVLAPAIN